MASTPPPMSNGHLRCGSKLGFKAVATTATRMIMVKPERSTPQESSVLDSGCRRASLASVKVVAVEEASPPAIAVIRTPSRSPNTRTAT